MLSTTPTEPVPRRRAVPTRMSPERAAPEAAATADPRDRIRVCVVDSRGRGNWVLHRVSFTLLLPHNAVDVSTAGAACAGREGGPPQGLHEHPSPTTRYPGASLLTCTFPCGTPQDEVAQLNARAASLKAASEALTRRQMTLVSAAATAARSPSAQADHGLWACAERRRKDTSSWMRFGDGPFRGDHSKRPEQTRT